MPTTNPIAPNTPRWFWEDLTPGLTTTFGPQLVDHDEVIDFAQKIVSQPFHLSEEAGKASLFGGLAASGRHTSSMVMRLMCDGFLLDSSSLGSPGLDSLKWTKTVMVSNEITALANRPMKSKAHVGLTQSRWEGINQRGEVLLLLESWAMSGRRHPAMVERGKNE